MKHLGERENKIRNEIKELHESNEALKVEVLSIIDTVKESVGVERENYTLKKRVIELEEE